MVCEDTGEIRSNTLYIALFVIGQLLIGVGGAGIYTNAIPYMDSNIQSKNTPMYIGKFILFT